MVDLDLISGVLPDSIVTGKKDDANNWHGDFPDWTYNTNYTSLSAFDNCVRINNLSDSSSVLVSRLAQKGFLLYFGMSSASTHPFEAGDYCFSIVLADGTVCTVPVQVLFNGASEHRYWTETFDWGQMGVVAAKTSSDKNRSGWWAFILPNPNSYVDVAYIEFIPGTSTDLQAEWVTTVTEMTDEQFKTPTLAVRTDLDITSYQIGGVRPSIPEKGQVWAMVENERIVSIQIYNGQAWESCDGRIWTGSRWIPASSYNIITLQDMYDIVDATPNYEYIYSESGFWSWWQKSWNAFTEKLFAALATGGTGSSDSSGGAGSSEMGNVDLDAEDPVSDPDQEDSKSLWQFIVLVVSGGKSVISGTRELFSGAVSSVPESMGDIVSTFDSGGLAVGLLDGSYLDPDAADLPQDDPGETAAEVEEVDPWRYR